jgi:hypothetical protein
MNVPRHNNLPRRQIVTKREFLVFKKSVVCAGMMLGMVMGISSATANAVSALLRGQKMDIPVTSVSDKWTQDSMAAQREGQPIPNTRIEPSPTVPASAVAIQKPDPAQDETTVQVVMSRLYDPSMTMAEIMQSEEMHKLSVESRERVVARMVEMINRGEIDARTFMSVGK